MRKLLLVLLTVLIVAVSVGCSAQRTTIPGTDSTQSTTPGSSGTNATGTPPTGTPPTGTPPTGTAPTASTSSSYTITGAYAQSSSTQTKTGQTYAASKTDESAVYVTKTGLLTLADAMVTSTGDTSSQDNSSFHGLNAAVLAADGGTITTSGLGANGAFATGTGSTVTLTKTKINAVGDGGHAVMATAGGSMTLTDVEMTTAGKNSGAIATDRGGGTITATGCTVTAKGVDSPAIYSTGAISVANSTLLATGAEAAVIEGANSITLTNSSLSSTKASKWGVLIYQSFSGDAQGSLGTFAVTGGSLKDTASASPLFYVTNTKAVITLKGVDVSVASGIFINAAGSTRWGTSGSNGGTVEFTADGQTIAGSVVADRISTVALTLKNGSSLTGTIDAAKTAKSVSLVLDASSKWTVTADSHLTSLTDSAIAGVTVSNIISNGHTVTYVSSADPGLGGKTYTLSGGGTLKPAG